LASANDTLEADNFASFQPEINQMIIYF